MNRRWQVPAVVAALGLALTGCSPAVALDPADDANDPGCAAVIVRLPGTVGGLERRETTAQATGAWGDPDQVVLRCGVAVPAASELPCIDKGIFWLRDDSDPDFWRFTTFGREPAIDLAVAKDIASGPGVVLDDLGNAVSFTTANGLVCTSTDDTVTGESVEPEGTPSPTPGG